MVKVMILCHKSLQCFYQIIGSTVIAMDLAIRLLDSTIQRSISNIPSILLEGLSRTKVEDHSLKGGETDSWEVCHVWTYFYVLESHSQAFVIAPKRYLPLIKVNQSPNNISNTPSFPILLAFPVPPLDPLSIICIWSLIISHPMIVCEWRCKRAPTYLHQPSSHKSHLIVILACEHSSVGSDGHEVTPWLYITAIYTKLLGSPKGTLKVQSSFSFTYSSNQTSFLKLRQMLLAFGFFRSYGLRDVKELFWFKLLNQGIRCICTVLLIESKVSHLIILHCHHFSLWILLLSYWLFILVHHSNTLILSHLLYLLTCPSLGWTACAALLIKTNLILLSPFFWKRANFVGLLLNQDVVYQVSVWLIVMLELLFQIKSGITHSFDALVVKHFG